MQIRVVERAQQIQIQEQEIVRRERELEALVKKPADAEKYKLEKLAEANRYKNIVSAWQLYMFIRCFDMFLLGFKAESDDGGGSGVGGGANEGRGGGVCH